MVSVFFFLLFNLIIISSYIIYYSGCYCTTKLNLFSNSQISSINTRASMATPRSQEMSRGIWKLRHQPEVEVTAHLSSILTAPEGDRTLLRAVVAGGKRTRWATSPLLDIPQLLPPPLFISPVPTVYLTAPHCPATAEERRVIESQLPLYHQGSLKRR